MADTVPNDLPQPLTTEQAQQQAQQQVASEIAAAEAPLESQISSLQGARDAAIKQIGETFQQIQPTVEQGAQGVTQAYQGAQQEQQAIFSAANARMNQLRQGRAQEAQMLAQQIGGPVAVDEFTAGFPEAEASLINLGAGSQLHTLAFAQAGEQEARQFSGQVFPVLRTEQEGKARFYYEDQIKQVRDQINALEAQRTALTNSRFNDLQKSQLDYALQRHQAELADLQAQHEWQMQKDQLAFQNAQLDQAWNIQQQQNALEEKKIKLESTKNQRDWKATLASLQNEQNRIDIARKQLGLDTYKTHSNVSLATAAEKRQAAALDLSVKEYQLKQAQLAANQKLAEKKLSVAEKQTWAQYLDAAVNPKPGGTVTITRAVPVTPTQAIKSTDAYKDPSSPTGYSRLAKVTQTAVTAPITNPGDLVDYLRAHGVPKSVAINMVKTRLRLPNWTYGQGLGSTSKYAGKH